MRTTRVLAVVSAMLFGMLALGAGPASATTVDECQARLDTLRADTVAAGGAFTNPADVNRLVAKVDAASAKLAEGKTEDAVEKLVDFQTTLNALANAPKPKVDAGVAQSLSAEAQAAIDCINGIEAG